MQVKASSLNTRRTYEAPHAEIIVIEPQGMLCVSGGAEATTAGGGIESMTISDIDWPN